MKACKFFAVLLLVMLLSIVTSVQAASLAIGDEMPDFSTTLSDGTTVTLHELLAEKKAVLINFWATWCPPCRNEFPALKQAYQNYAEDMSVLCLSVEPTDTLETIAAFKAQNDLDVLYMGADQNHLYQSFPFEGAIPGSVMVDRFGVICWMEVGAIFDNKTFERMFRDFTSEKYIVSKTDYELPGPDPDIESASNERLNQAANVEGGTLLFSGSDNPNAWPFLPTDKGALYAANTAVNTTNAELNTCFTARAGDVLAFDYSLYTEATYDELILIVNDQDVAHLSGSVLDWAVCAYELPQDGDYRVTWKYHKNASVCYDSEFAMIDHVRLLQGDEAQEALLAAPQQIRSLKGDAYELTPMGHARRINFRDDTGIVMLMSEDWPFYLMEGETGRFKVRIGDQLDANEILFYGDHEYYMKNATLASDTDQDGYIFETTLSTMSNGKYSNTYIYLLPNHHKNENEYQMLVAFANEANLDYFCNIELPVLYGIKGISWEYADEPVETYESYVNNDAAYTIYVQDNNGTPVAGAMVQVCDDTTCEVLKTDETGMIEFHKPAYAYEIHMLTVPNGYEKTTEIFQMPVHGGSITITVDRQ